jgi:hypothetical protein
MEMLLEVSENSEEKVGHRHNINMCCKTKFYVPNLEHKFKR